MHKDHTLDPEGYAPQARQLHHALLQATELQLHRAVDRAVEEYRRSRNPGSPLAVNLFPALRARYGNLLNAQLLSAEIVLNQPEALIDGQIPPAARASGELPDIAFFFTIAGIHDSEPVLWEAHAPGQALPRSLDIAELMAFVETLADADLIEHSLLFTGHAQSVLMSQAGSQQALEQLADDLDNAQGRAAFYQAAFETLAEADKTPVLATIYEALKDTYRRQSALGTGSEDATSYWLELGEIADEGSGHTLESLAQSEIDSDVRAALKALPQAAQLVLWHEHDGMRGFFDDDYRYAARASLLDDGDCVDRIVGQVCGWLMGSARNDWHSRGEKP